MDAFAIINGNDTLHSLTGMAQFHEMPCGGVVINMRDDFTSQPSGNSGEKIACGVIQSIK